MGLSSKSSSPASTVLVITVGFGVLFFITKQNWLLHFALIVGVLGAISDFIAYKIDWIWTKIGWILSKIVPTIVLSLVFYLILTPTAFLSRIFGKHDPLDLKNQAVSLFKSKSSTFSKESFEKPW